MAKNNKTIENIFDLTQIGNRVADIQAEHIRPIITPVNRAELLTDYTSVDSHNWINIQPGTHIRYLRQDGEFRKGGFINDVTETQDKEGNNTLRFDLVSDYKPTAIKWSLFGSSIDKIWAKLPIEVQQPTPVPTSVINELKQELKICKETIQMLQKEVQKINNEQMRTVLLIKKLHNIQ